MAFNPLQFLAKVPPISIILAISKRLVLPGFDGLPLYDVGSFFIRGIQRGSIIMRGSAVAFKFFLAIFPALIFLFALIPYVPVENFHDALLEQLQNLMPESAYELASATIEDIIRQGNSGLLSIGFLLTIYFASNGISAMITGFNLSYYVTERRMWIKKRLLSLILLFLYAAFTFTAVGLVTFSEEILNEISQWLGISPSFPGIVIQTGKWLVIGIFFYLAIALFYAFGPSETIKRRFFSAGASLATVLVILISLGFSFYVNNFAQYNKLYGSIGTLIVIMLWIYYNCIVLLIGFDLNASIASAGLQRKENEEGETAIV